ncbi:hypothetical protein EV361DRAFT_912578 [Lentinula raphanica]|nr:hypothetical protein EV361DRAFT_912578 [Lentinula raphanica]
MNVLYYHCFSTRIRLREQNTVPRCIPSMTNYAKKIPDNRESVEIAEGDKIYVLKLSLFPILGNAPRHIVSAAGEVKALRSIGREVEAGFASLRGEKKDSLGVIKMPKIPGDSFAWGTQLRQSLQNAHPEKGVEFFQIVEILKSEVKTMISGYLQHGFIHVNPGPGNVHTTSAAEINLQDFDDVNIYKIHRVPSPDEFDKFFEKRWNFLWRGIYQQIERLKKQNGDSEQSLKTKENVEGGPSDQSLKTKEDVEGGSSSKMRDLLKKLFQG